MRRVLLNWYYHRLDLTEYLLTFSEDMELVFLFKQFHEPEPRFIEEGRNISAIYWGDYDSPYELLEKVRPDIVVFADLESFNQIALNIAARNLNIKTFVLQHGIRGDYEVDEALNTKGIAGQSLNFSPTSKWSVRFFAKSLRLKNLSALPRLLKFIYARKKGELTSALFKNQFELRRADYYIEFSADNAGYHKKRDGIPNERFIITGNPQFDDFFDYLNTNSFDGSYCLLIDCPFVEAGFIKDHGIDQESKNKYLKKLDDLTLANGYKLKVKLHPLSYESRGLYESSNIEYIREADLKALTAGARMVYFVHFSSLAPVILAYKPAIYFHSVLKEHGALFNKLGVTSFPLFEFDDSSGINFETVPRLTLESLVSFLHVTDGKATERVKKILNGEINADTYQSGKAKRELRTI